MCGRFASSSSAEDLVEFFEIDEVADPLPGPAFNIAPTDPITAVVSRPGDGRLTRSLRMLRWGLVPSWAKDASGAGRLINARVETVAEKPSFRKAFATRRCLIPADGYYEWQTIPQPGRRPRKQPYFIRPHGADPLVMAGLYEFWKAPGGGWLTTATIITADATDALGRLHDRMPMVVEPENWRDWLDGSAKVDPLKLLSVPVNQLDYYPVSTAVNRVGTDGPGLLERVEVPE